MKAAVALVAGAVATGCRRRSQAVHRGRSRQPGQGRSRGVAGSAADGFAQYGRVTVRAVRPPKGAQREASHDFALRRPRAATTSSNRPNPAGDVAASGAGWLRGSTATPAGRGRTARHQVATAGHDRAAVVPAVQAPAGTCRRCRCRRLPPVPACRRCRSTSRSVPRFPNYRRFRRFCRTNDPSRAGRKIPAKRVSI